MANSHLDPVLLSAYLDDEVSADERALVKSHLATCEACQLELDSLSWTVNLLHRLPEETLPRNFYITEAMLEEPPSRTSSWNWLQWLQSLVSARSFAPLGAAVGALLLLMVIIQSPFGTFSTASDTQIAMQPLATAEMDNKPTIAALSESLEMASQEPAMEEPEITADILEEADVAQAPPFEDQSSAEIAEESGQSVFMIEPEPESAEESEAAAVLAEVEPDTSFDAAASADAEVVEAEPKESVVAAPPSQARAAAPTARAANTPEPLPTPTLVPANTPKLLSPAEATATSETLAQGRPNSQLAPQASSVNEQNKKESTQESEASQTNTQTFQMMLIATCVLLLLIVGVMFWRKK